MRCSTHIARRRLAAWATAVLVATGIAAGTATAASAQPGPAAGVAPGATAASNGFNYVFYTASDGSVWQKAAGSTSPATSVGGRLVSAPSPIFNGTNIQVFGQGTDNALWTTSCAPGGGCGPWTSLGGALTSKPGAVQVDTTHAYDQSVYARGTDGALWARDNTATGWANWHFVGGQLLAGTGPCAAVPNGSHTQYVLAVGTDRGLWLDRIGGPGFGPVGGRTTATPAMTDGGNASSGLVGYARGTDGALWWENVLNPTGWNSLGGFLTSGCGGATNGGVPYAYALGGDSQVWQNRNLDPTMWTRVTP